MELGNLIVLLSLLSVSCWICLVDSRSTAPSGPSINSRRRPVIHQQRFDHRYNNHNKKRQHVDHRKQESPRHPQRPPPDVVRRLPIRPVGPATRRHPQQTAKTPTLVGHKKFEFELGRPVDDFLSNFPDVNEVQFEIGNLQGLMPNVYQGMKPPVMTKPARPDNDDQYRYRNQPPADANEDHQQAGPENDGHIKPFWGPPLTSPTPSHHRPSSVTPRILATASSPTTEPNNRGRDGEDIQKTIDDFRSTLLKHPGSADGVLKPGTHQTNGKEKDGGSLYHHDEEDENSNHFDDQKKMPVVPDHSSVKQPSPSAGPGIGHFQPTSNGLMLMSVRNDDYYPVEQKPNYHHQVASPTYLDFTPIFLALIPIALVLGAAASFALATAVRPNQAVALAQQQQQQQEESSNNNNANNNNALLETLVLNSIGSKSDHQHNYPFIIVVNGTTPTTGRKRRKRRTLTQEELQFVRFD